MATDNGISDPIMGLSRGSLTLERGISVLDVMRTADGPLGLREIARRVGVSRPAAHRLLFTLTTSGFVQQDEASREYRLGWALLRYSDALLRQTNLVDLAPTVARRLRDATDETVTVQLRAGSDRVVVYEAEGQQEVHRRVGVGTRLPLHAGASGLAILAFLPEAERSRVLAFEIDALTPATLTDPNLLSGRLADIRKAGVAQSEGETVIGASAIAAPIWKRGGEVVGSIAVSGPTWRWREVVEIATPLVLQAASELSARLGFVAPTSLPRGAGTR